MLTRVDIQTDRGNFLSLPIDDTSQGYILERIDGLDPVRATMVSTGFAQLDGEYYQSSRRGTRNIKIKIGLEPDYATTTVSDLRHKLYNYFMPRSEVKLTFYDSGSPHSYIKARVETFETELFTNEPTVDISLIAFSPDFIDMDEVVLSGQTSSAYMSASATIVHDYEGTIPTGFIFSLSVNRSLSEFAIYNIQQDATIPTQFEMDYAFQSGDLVEVSTVPGDKYVMLTRAGIKSSILYSVRSYSNWLTIGPGANMVMVYATGAAIPYTITFTPRYGGL